MKRASGTYGTITKDNNIDITEVSGRGKKEKGAVCAVKTRRYCSNSASDRVPLSWLFSKVRG